MTTATSVSAGTIHRIVPLTPLTGPIDPITTLVYCPSELPRTQLLRVLGEIFGGQSLDDAFPHLTRGDGERDLHIITEVSPTKALCSGLGTIGLAGRLQALLPHGGSAIVLDTPASAGLLSSPRRRRRIGTDYESSLFWYSLIAAAKVVHGAHPLTNAGAYLLAPVKATA